MNLKHFSGQFFLFVALISFSAKGSCQQGDSLSFGLPVKKHALLRNFCVPVTLVGLGTFGAAGNNFLKGTVIKQQRDKYFPSFNNHADNYFQFAPALVVYAMDGLGIKGKHGWKEQTLLLGRAQVMMMAFVFPLKKYVHIHRPDSSGYNSFPSGHTAQAFMAATFFTGSTGSIIHGLLQECLQ
jgi:hypothetical protein